MPLFEKKCWDSFCTLILFVVFFLVTGCESCEVSVEPEDPGTEIDPTDCMTPTPEQLLFVVIDTDFMDEISCFANTSSDLRNFYDMDSPMVDAWYTSEYFDYSKYFIAIGIMGYCASGEMFIKNYSYDDFTFDNDIAFFFIPEFEKGDGTLTVQLRIRTICGFQNSSCDEDLDCPGPDARGSELIFAFKELVITGNDDPEIWFDKNDFFIDMVDCQCY